MRNRALLALSLAMLASSAGLGLLVHDAAIGADHDRLLTARIGEPLRLKGELAPVQEVADPALHDILLQHTVRLESGLPGVTVLVTADTQLPTNGTWIVDGALLHRQVTPQWGLLVVGVDDLTAPFLFG